jgi:tetratricopeptide (TPR) repeat protein
MAGRFRPVGPNDRERAREPIRAELPAPRPAEPQNPLARHDALLQSGRRAFASGEYGRAVELFKQAIERAPAIGASYFLLAQSQFALGKYLEAVASIHEGLLRQPDWPAFGQPLRELYAIDLEAFAEHQRRLNDAAAHRPDDTALEFLRAYVHWFDGRRDEARLLFQQLRDRVTRPAAIDRFLQVPVL